jgi:sigma54-dependent transcription regulator
MVPVNCASIPENLIESELFGHVKGAFTGADKDKKGLFEIAEGGTLFLDEIGDIPVALQPKLLRVLQESEIRPVGGASPKAVNVRVIAATSKDLETEMADRGISEKICSTASTWFRSSCLPFAIGRKIFPSFASFLSPGLMKPWAAVSRISHLPPWRR